MKPFFSQKYEYQLPTFFFKPCFQFCAYTDLQLQSLCFTISLMGAPIHVHVAEPSETDYAIYYYSLLSADCCS
jgi:hypothetical protein